MGKRQKCMLNFLNFTVLPIVSQSPFFCRFCVWAFQWKSALDTKRSYNYLLFPAKLPLAYINIAGRKSPRTLYSLLTLDNLFVLFVSIHIHPVMRLYPTFNPLLLRIVNAQSRFSPLTWIKLVTFLWPPWNIYLFRFHSSAPARKLIIIMQH